jgi:hypothetical protein
VSEEQQASFTGWAKVEIMGHQSHIGFVRTEAYGQAVLFRIDVPSLPEREFVLEDPEYIENRWTPAGSKVQRPAIEGTSVLVGSGSIYRMLPCSEAAAMKAIESLARPQLKIIELAQQKAIEPSYDNVDAEFDGDPEGKLQ